MTKFNPENKEKLTVGETLGPAMEITDQEDADQYLKEYVAFIAKQMNKEGQLVHTTGSAEHIALHNIGYYAGYYDRETMERVKKLFKASHPIFG